MNKHGKITKCFIILCTASSIADVSVRLVDGDTPNEGRVEIYHKYRKSLFLETAMAKHKIFG